MSMLVGGWVGVFVDANRMYVQLYLLVHLVQETDGVVCGGGASVYYSHTLSMLFFSYHNGELRLLPVSMLSK